MRDVGVTKREMLLSIVIAAIMLVFGFLISAKINDKLMDRFQEYNTALQIDNDKELFEYGMRTNIGNAFVYGELRAVDPVTYKEIGGEYSCVEKVKEKYTKHYRYVTKTKKVDGKTVSYQEREEYWTWDEVDKWEKSATKTTFVNVEFPYGAIPFPGKARLETRKESSKIRYIYYGSPASVTGTLYTKLCDETISDIKFHTNSTIPETLKTLGSRWQLVVFWLFWILFICGCVAAFCYIDNRWIEDGD